MRGIIAVGVAALMLSVGVGCSGLSQPEDIQVQAEVVMLNPPPQVPIAAPNRAAPGGRPAVKRRSGG